MMLKLSTSGRTYLKGLEALRLTAYADSKGVPTIGWGHTTNVSLGDTLPDEAAAEALLSEDVAWAEQAVNDNAGPYTSQLQFDAMVLLTFNIGTGLISQGKTVPGFITSTVLKAHIRGDYQSAARAFALWNMSGGKIIAGLITRRAKEAAMYLDGSPKFAEGEVTENPKPDTTVDKPLTQSRITAGSITAIISTITATGTSISQLTGDAGTTFDHVKSFGLPPLWLAIGAGVMALAALGYVLYARIDDKLRGFK